MHIHLFFMKDTKENKQCKSEIGAVWVFKKSQSDSANQQPVDVNKLEQHVSECDGVLVVFCPDMWGWREWSPSMCQIHIKGKCWAGPKHLPTQLLFSGEDNRAQGGTWNWGCYIIGVCVCADIDNQRTQRERKKCAWGQLWKHGPLFWFGTHLLL